MTFNEDQPIFAQIAEQLKDAIISGAYSEESQIPSITDYSVNYKINPATALKGINQLVDEGLLYKKRGVGMFVSKGAREILLKERRNSFFEDYIKRIVKEAKNLGFSPEELSDLIRKGYQNVN